MITRKPIGEQPFTTFSNALLNDNSLNSEALGVLVYLLSKPGNWNVMPGVVGKRFGCGRDKIYRILLDLINAGYASREPDRDVAGVIRGWNYLVSNEKTPLPENPEVDARPLPENTTSGKSAPQKKDSKTKERKKDSRPADDVYSEDFQALWQQAAQLGAPRTRNTSKKKAYDNWRMLNSEKQEQVRGAIPVFAAAMRAEARPEDKIPHFEFWLSKRIYETVSAPPAAAAKAVLVDWHKTAKREQWIKVLPHWRANYSWNPVWGPAPGEPGCMLPEDLLTELEKYQIILQRDGRKAAEAAMKDGSQLRDAINAAHRAA